MENNWLNNLRYVDSIVATTENFEDLHRMLADLEGQSQKIGLS